MACILCGNKDTESQGAQGFSGDFYNCPICGRFIIENDVLYEYQDINHLVAGYLHETNLKNGGTFIIDKVSINEILNSEKIPNTTMKKLEKVLLFYYKKKKYIGQNQKILDNIHPCFVYAKDWSEVYGALKLLKELKWAEISLSNHNSINDCTPKDLNGDISLTALGLAHAEQLSSTSINSNKVFIATQFRSVDGYAFPYKEVREKAIKPAVEAASNNKLRAFTVDEEEHNDYITDKMIAEIRTSRFLIADLTHNNNGAYWEAGYAKGLGKEVIYICNQDWLDSGNKLHFDIEQISGIRWRTLNELKEKLINRIRATIL